jgi:CheY-like chemotaxis protein
MYRNVLLIDDAENENHINKTIIRSCGFAGNVISFTSARLALSYLRTQENQNLPDIIFLDIMMPEMDGFSFLNEFAGFKGEVIEKVKIVMLTSSVDLLDYKLAMMSPFVISYLKKPLNRLELMAIASHQSMMYR